MEGRRRGRPVDLAARHKGMRWNREKGIRVYIPAECLERAGIGADDSEVYYRVWAAPGGRVILNLYSEP